MKTYTTFVWLGEFLVQEVENCHENPDEDRAKISGTCNKTGFFCKNIPLSQLGALPPAGFVNIDSFHFKMVKFLDLREILENPDFHALLHPPIAEISII